MCFSQVPGGVHAGIATVPVLPTAIPRGQPLPASFYGGNVTGYHQQGPMMMPIAGGAGGGVPPGVPVIVGQTGGCAAHPQGPAIYNQAAADHNRSLPQPYGPYNGAYNSGAGHGHVHAAQMAPSGDECLQPVDFKPVCDDPSKMFFVRQTDKEWCRMPWATIESFGNRVRWYIQDNGAMYAEKFED